MKLRAWVGAVAVLVVVPLCASAAEKDEAELKERLNKLEKENDELRDKLSKANQQTKKLFDEATRAEKAAGIEFRRPTAVVSQSTAATTPPVAAPLSKHGYVRFSEAELELNVSFAASRPVRTMRVHDAVCEVTKRNR